MKIHTITDLSNNEVTSLLTVEFSKITDKNIVVNYHPDHNNSPANIFYLLKNGRYKNGAYYIMEDDGKYVCSAGWNPYFDIPGVAIVLSRMYVSTVARSMYLVGKYILPNILNDAADFEKLWITCNEYNKPIYNWFVRSAENKSPVLFNNWPDIYKKFKPIGTREIYHTLQYVAELDTNES